MGHQEHQRRMADRQAAYKPASTSSFKEELGNCEKRHQEHQKRFSDREASYSYDFSEPQTSNKAFAEEATYKPTYSYNYSDPLSSELNGKENCGESYKDFNFSDKETFQPFQSSLLTRSYPSESQDNVETKLLDKDPTIISPGGPTNNSYKKQDEEDDIYVRPVINFDPTFNPRKYLYDDDCDVDEILRKIRGETVTSSSPNTSKRFQEDEDERSFNLPSTSPFSSESRDVDEILRKIRGEKVDPLLSTSSFFSPSNSERFREVEDERPYNISSTSPFSSKPPSFSSTYPSSQIPSHSPPSSSDLPSFTSSLDSRVECPICGVAFHQDIIERHAASCGDS